MNHYFDMNSIEVSRLIEYAALAYQKNLTNACGGNVSVKYGDNIIISCTNASLRKLTENTLACVTMDGEILYSAEGQKPSKELMMHLAVYKTRRDVNSVFHLHPPASTAVSAVPGDFPSTTESAREKLPVLPKIPYFPAGSIELAEALKNVLASGDVRIHGALLENHGLISFGSSIVAAFNFAELIEASAINLIYKKILGL